MGELVVEITDGATSFTDTGLTADTEYAYAVFAHDEVPDYAPAVTATATTQTASDTRAPGEVLGVRTSTPTARHR